MAEADTRIIEACYLAEWYGSIDGAHHKQWIIDQMLRCLLADRYEAWVRHYNEEAKQKDTDEWDEGIAP